MNQNLIENKKTRQGLDSFHLVRLSDTGNTLNNFVNITPPAENSSRDSRITNTESPVLKSTQNQQNAQFLQKSSQTPLKAEFLTLKCFTKDELNDIRETIEKVSEKFDQIFYREYTKNLWDEIASKNTIISLLTENINNLSRLHSQSEACYQPQKHNKAQNTQVLLDN